MATRKSQKKNQIANLLINILVAVLSLAIFFASAEWMIVKYFPEKVRTYFDDQTEIALGHPVPKKSPGETRIFVFGSSAAYGFPAADRYSITAWLRKSFVHLLPTHTVRVINCGWPGKSSHHVYEGARTVMKYQPDLFIIYSGHNEFTVSNRLYIDNWFYWLNFKLEYRSALYRLLASRIARIRKHLTYGSSGYPEKSYREEVIANRVYKKIEVRDDEYQRILKAYRKNMEKVIRLAKRRKVQVLFVNLPSNVRDIPPAFSFHRPDLTAPELVEWQIHYESAQKFYANGLYQQALDAYRRAAAIDDTYAELAFQTAQTQEKLENFSAAKADYIRARDLDGQPWRAKSSLNDTIREIAAKNHVLFADIVRAFEMLSPHGIVEGNLIHDNVHPSIKGQQLITDEILRTLCQHHFIAPADEWKWGDLDKARETHASDEWTVEGAQNAYRYILRGLHLWEQGRYGGVIEDLEKGLELMPEFVESYGFIADAYWNLGRKDKAREVYQAFQEKYPKVFEMLIHRYPNLEDSYKQSRGAFTDRPD
ncbi:MAG: tetratricopeptide repeat protein [Candidatus Omnitrophica bacterium]|nr:tetratricopeptide repeat protein [Candidatus Omnitrophota bacterium]